MSSPSPPPLDFPSLPALHTTRVQELMKRQQELEKLHTLDQKIGVELKSLNEKMATMQTEMVTYANIDELKASNDRISELLEEKKVAYQRRCDGARAQVNLLAARYGTRLLVTAVHLPSWVAPLPCPPCASPCLGKQGGT
jgi:hypothetical protein